jgi:hypothetical protein
VAGLVPGQLLGWSWPDRLRHALALAAGGARVEAKVPGGPEGRSYVDLATYERLLDVVSVKAGLVRGASSAYENTRYEERILQSVNV